MKTIIKIIASLVLIAAICVCASITGAVILNSPPEDMPKQTFFKVDKGDTAREIGQNLEEDKLIKSSKFFLVYVKLKKTSAQMKTGLYKIDYGQSMVGIHDILIQGSEELFNVTIPPGHTSREIAKILEEKEIVNAEDFVEAVKLQHAEGFLFPDTYNFPKGYPAEKVVKYMTENFHNYVKSIYSDYDKLEQETIKEKVVLASIVEREYRVAEEAPIIASTFYNRIEHNMYLGSCATVVYIITEVQGKAHPERLFYRDLEVESPYNTYKHKGLPPGPICNPGRIAINASFNPAETDYLYFLLEDPDTGQHKFSKNWAEHNKSYNLYIKGR
ncbi:MAG: endolytic transglycosylase MltG [Spirochaetales bacterium]|nr:endolytic transglycosylase MltG [Spirochaetales bacterium]